jgi:hypothetical protein
MKPHSRISTVAAGFPRFVLAGTLVLAIASLRAAAPGPPPPLEEILNRISARVAEFYQRGKDVICIETSAVQAVSLSNAAEGFMRTVESELHVETGGGDAPDEATVVRTIRKVNGRVPRANAKKDRDGCTDPNPLSPEPLAFLLPGHRAEYKFRMAGVGKERDRPVVMIDFVSVHRRRTPELFEDPNGHDDCFDWTGPLASRGRVWADTVTYDVIRAEQGIPGPVDIVVPPLIQRRYRLPNWVTLVRDDVTTRYKTVAFTNPDETLLLPESIDSFTQFTGGLQSMRRRQTFSGYKRFVTEGRMIQ